MPNIVCALWVFTMVCPFMVLASCSERDVFVAPTGAMEPTIKEGQRFRIDRGAYKQIDDVQRWDIVVYERSDTKDLAVKRIAGLPGEMIEWSSGGVKVDGRPLDIPEHLKGILKGFSGPGAESGTQKIPIDALFVIGDRISGSKDSRYDGPVRFTAIRGKVVSIDGHEAK